jgi:predicted anti-sigma-YlaC factor YlaD
MLTGFGIFEGAVGVVMSLWFIHVGFLVKKLLKEQQETNRILRQLGSAGSSLGGDTKAA